jgi:hypothetical protein
MDWRQWCAANFIATEAEINASADMFHEHFTNPPIALTPEEWFTKWRRWCIREKRFVKRLVPTSLANEGDGAAEGVAADRDWRLRVRIQIKALEWWLSDEHPWDAQLGPAPKSKAEAQARIAELEATISDDFRASPPSPPVPSPSTDQGVASCG